MKNINYKNIKAISNLPKYDIGKMPSTLGYQRSTQPETAIGYVDNPGADLTSMAKAERQNTVSNAVTGGLNTATQFGTMVPTLMKAGEAAAAKAAGTAGAGAGASIAAGYGAGALGAITGGLQMASGITGMKNSLTEGDLQQWAGSQTNFGIANRQYKTLTNNAQGAMNVGMQKMRQAGTDMSLGAAGAGAGIGSIIGLAAGSGSAAGPIGAGIGALAGLGIGLGTFFGMKSKQQDRMQDLINNQTKTFAGFNKQSMAVANSEGMRDEYGYKRAKDGIQPGTVLKKKGNKQLVNSAYGLQYAKPNAITNGDELIIDTQTGAASNVEGDSKENKATVVNPQDAIINAKYADAARMAIATGNNAMLADIINEQGKDMTRKQKQTLHNYACGKLPKFRYGTPGWRPMTPWELMTEKKGMFPNNQEWLDAALSYTPDTQIPLKINNDYGPYFPMGDKTKWSPYSMTVPNTTQQVEKAQDIINYYTRPELGENNIGPYPIPEANKEYMKPYKTGVSTTPNTKQSAGTTPKQNYGNGSGLPMSLLAGSYLSNQAAALSQYFKDRGITPRRINTYNPSNAASTYARIAAPYKDMSWLQDMNNQVKQQLWRYRHYNPNQRQIMEDSALRSGLAARANQYNVSHNQYLNHLAEYGKNIANYMASDAARMDTASRYADQSFNQQLSKKNDYIRTDLGTIMNNNSDLAKNFMNMYFGNKEYKNYDLDGWL